MLDYPLIHTAFRGLPGFRGFDRLLPDLFDAAIPQLPVVDVEASQDAIVLTAEVPGADRQDVDLEIENDVFTIRVRRPAPTPAEGETVLRSERPYGTFERAFSLPYRVEGDKVEATLKDGLLRVRLHRVAADRPQRIAIRES